jgi:hypothetical protein
MSNVGDEGVSLLSAMSEDERDPELTGMRESLGDMTECRAGHIRGRMRTVVYVFDICETEPFQVWVKA